MFLQTAFYTRNCVHVGNQTFNSSCCTSGTQRLSRKHETSGGVLLGIHSSLNSHRITVAITSDAESVAAKILSGKQSIVFGSFYRPPSNDQAYMDRLTEVITCLCKSDPKATYWIADDADLPNINWFIDQVTHHQYNLHVSDSFLQTLAKTGLEQIVDFPARYDNTLDIVLTNRP